MTAKARKSTTPKVDETVVNQENPVTSEVSRESTETPLASDEFVKNYPANEVDETVKNQESPGTGTFVDRNPEPVIVDDGVNKYDVSKSYPELQVADNSLEEKARKAKVRQESAAMNAKELVELDEDHKHIVIEFVDSGLTVQGRVWKAGESLTMEDSDENRRGNADTEDNVWYEQSSDDQVKRYGKVFFEKK